MIRPDRRHRRATLLMTCWAWLACAPSGGARYPARAVESHTFTNRDGLALLAVRVADSEPQTFVLDTGASPCVIDSAFAAAAGIASVATAREGQGGAGSFKRRVATSPINLGIGSQNLSCRETIVLDLSGLTDVIGERITGLVGGDFFRGRVVRIDYDRSIVSVFERDSYPSSSTRIPIRVDGNRPYVTALLSVPGGSQKGSRQLLIDTGSRDQVDDRLLAESSRAVRAVTPTGVGSGGTALAGTFNEVSIGPHVFHDVPGVAGNVSIVGAGLLQKFNLVFDYDGAWVDLEERQR